MEPPNSRGSSNFVVGLFVVVAVLVISGFVVFMGGATRLTGEIKVRTVLNDVRGVNQGAPVFVSGIQVGRVAATQFPKGANTQEGVNPQGITTVFSIFRDYSDRVKTDSHATITTQGVLGDKVIVITPGSIDAQPVKDGDFIVADQPKELGEYLAKGGNLVENLSEVAFELNVLLKGVNHNGKVETILKNLETTSNNLAAITSKVQSGKGSLGALIQGDGLKDLEPSLASLRKILDKVNKGEGTLGALINDPSLHEDLRVLLGGAQRSTTVRFLLRQAIQSGDKKAAAEAAPKEAPKN